MFLLMFLVAPLVGIISVFALDREPWPVGIAVILLGLGGLLRIAYALMFESGNPSALAEGRGTGELHPPSSVPATSFLPPQRDIPASEYVSPARPLDTDDLQPASVTENTTKLLEKDADPLA
jgi:hypothetical protein